MGSCEFLTPDTFIFHFLLVSFASQEEVHKNKTYILCSMSLDYFLEINDNSHSSKRNDETFQKARNCARKFHLQETLQNQFDFVRVWFLPSYPHRD